MKVHHLNCTTMCPRPARLVNGTGFLGRGRMVCHCLLVETKDGLLLVDTGVGLADMQARGGRMGRGFSLVAGARFDPEESAVRQVVRLGYQPSDVRHVLPTHLDLDHVSGAVDFPQATLHTLDREHDAAMKRATFFERHRYLPALWSYGPQWKIHATRGDRWLGLDAVRVSDEPEVWIVPMIGHTRGHSAVAVRSGDRWLVHCGDAYFSRGEIHAPTRECPAGLRFFQWLIEVDRKARLASQDRLRALVHERTDVTAFSAHCPVEFDRLAGAAANPATAPASQLGGDGGGA